MSKEATEHREGNVLLNWISKLKDIAKELKGDKFPQVVLEKSIYEFSYILERIEELMKVYNKSDFSSINQEEVEEFGRTVKLINFYAQCLVLWGHRILDILNETAGFEIPTDIKIARNILVAHFGIAFGDLKSKINRKQGFISSPKISPNGNLTYVIGPLGNPKSSELETIKKLYKKYFLGKPMPNIQEICNIIMCNDEIEIEKQDLEKIKRFIRNNGGTITDSKRIMSYVLNSLNQYLTLNQK